MATIIVAAALAILVFVLGFFTSTAIHNFADAKVEKELALAASLEQEQQEAEKLKTEENSQNWKYVTASSNIERDITADTYAVKIAATCAIAEQYQYAKMQNQLNDPDIIAQLYEQFSTAADAKVAEYLETYEIATKKASNQVSVSRDKYYNAEKTTYLDKDAFYAIYQKDKGSAALEKGWQNYNTQVLNTAVLQMKSEALQEILSGELL